MKCRSWLIKDEYYIYFSTSNWIDVFYLSLHIMKGDISMKITFKIIYYHYSKKVISSKVNLYYYLISWTQTIQGNCSSASISEVLIQASALGIVRISIEVRKRSLRRESGNYQRRLFTELRLAISAVSHCSGPLFTRTSFQECYTTRQLVVAISRQSISSLETHEASFPKSIDIRTSLWYPPPPPPFHPSQTILYHNSSLPSPNLTFSSETWELIEQWPRNRGKRSSVRECCTVVQLSSTLSHLQDAFSRGQWNAEVDARPKDIFGSNLVNGSVSQMGSRDPFE